MRPHSIFARGPIPSGTVFHGTDRQFETLDVSDCLGMHFGTTEAAIARLHSTGRLHKQFTPVETDDGQWLVEEEAFVDADPVMHGPFESEDAAESFVDAVRGHDSQRKPLGFSLSVANPLMLEDLGQWTFPCVFRHLADIDFLNEEAERDAIWNAWQTSDQLGWQAIRGALEKRGFDSVAYRNDVEDRGSISWIAFHDHQIAPIEGSTNSLRTNAPRVQPSQHAALAAPTAGEQLWSRLQERPIEETVAWLEREHPDVLVRANRLVVVDEEYRLDNLSAIVPANELRALPPLDHATTVWRGLPLGARIRPGDWISLTADYARAHGDRTMETPRIDALHLVQCSDIYWAGTDMREFFYLPQAWRGNGQSASAFLQSLTRDMVLALVDGELAPLSRHADAIESIRTHVTNASEASDELLDHGPGHWNRAMLHAAAVSRALGISPLVPSVFALVHDSQRMHDGDDPEHGPRAARFVRENRQALFGFLDATEIDLLCQACVDHSDGVTHGPAHVQACFDADRLDLGRVNICPSPRYLCTDYARQSGVIRQALAMAGAEHLTEEVDEDEWQNVELCR